VPIEGRSVGRERVVRTLTFWLRPAFALRVVNRFQPVAGFDRAVALASSALTALIPLAVVSGAVLQRVGVKDFADPCSSRPGSCRPSVALGREVGDELARIRRGERPPDHEVRQQWDIVIAEARSRWGVAHDWLDRRLRRDDDRRP
jgi:hypothetical protein